MPYLFWYQIVILFSHHDASAILYCVHSNFIITVDSSFFFFFWRVTTKCHRSPSFADCHYFDCRQLICSSNALNLDFYFVVFIINFRFFCFCLSTLFDHFVALFVHFVPFVSNLWCIVDGNSGQTFISLHRLLFHVQTNYLSSRYEPNVSTHKAYIHFDFRSSSYVRHRLYCPVIQSNFTLCSKTLSGPGRGDFVHFIFIPSYSIDYDCMCLCSSL